MHLCLRWSFIFALHTIAKADVSVLHFTLPGSVPETGTGPGEVVVADIFVKVLALPSGRRWRGFAFFASVEPKYHTWGGDLSMPPAVVGWKPNIYLRSHMTGNIHNATVIDNMTFREHNQLGEHRLGMPTQFHGTLPEKDDLYELRVEDWDRFGLVSSTDASWEEDFSPKHWLVLPPVRNVPNLRLDPVMLVAHNVDYHCGLGFHVSVYVLPHQRGDFMQSAHLRPYIESGKLEIVVWEQVPECTHFSSCQHALQNSHATLAAWGQQRLLTFIDVDEFVAFPNNVSLDMFSDTCIKNSTSVTFQRFDFTCLTCLSESNLWFGPESLFEPHPLTHYGQVIGSHAYASGKSMVDSNHVLGYAIHGGYRLHGNHTNLPHECGRVLHIVNMFSTRETVNGSELPVGAWKRPFKS